jgi:mannose-6-phosphate isomerase-like protein (cupin superfamily)
VQAQQAFSLDAKQIEQAIHDLPTHPPTNREVITADHYAVKVAVVDHRNGPAELHRSGDRVLYVLHGRAELCTGGTMKTPHDLSPTEAQAPELDGCTSMSMTPGAVISIPRGIPYQLRAVGTRVEFLVVRVEGR